jgi:lipopolysaccharide/colanic/teichoic acid biosynthesis glycosyltransferase
MTLTRLGKFLSWTSLDYLPNLLSVISGEMSLMGSGPRPALVSGDLVLKAVLNVFRRSR